MSFSDMAGYTGQAHCEDCGHIHQVISRTDVTGALSSKESGIRWTSKTAGNMTQCGRCGGFIEKIPKDFKTNGVVLIRCEERA
jgi:hypothetical protein